MNDRPDFERARQALSTSHLDRTTLCAPFVSVLPVTGASLSILVSGAGGQSTVCASDATAARLDELQFDLGEGPCWDAMRSRRPVLSSRFRETGVASWPAFGEAVASDTRTGRIASVFAFPLAIGSLEIGAVDLYSTVPTDLDRASVTDALDLADVASWQVLRKILGEQFDDDADFARREVHQATGMILAQLAVSADDAALLLRAHAFAAGRSVRAVASDVVQRRIDFSRDGRPATEPPPTPELG